MVIDRHHPSFPKNFLFSIKMFTSALAGVFASFASYFSKLAVSKPEYVLLVGLSNFLMWICFLNALKSQTSLKSQVLNSSFNLLTTLVLGYWSGEVINNQKIVGGIVILIGSLLVNRKDVNQKKDLKQE
jgi:drug/metabolite transporter (DMT)-like permease